MKVILYMAISVDGYIATADDETPWSKEEWQSFIEATGRVGNLIIGRRTYEIMLRGGEFENLTSKLVVVVVTSKASLKRDDRFAQQFFFVSSPSAALDLLKRKEFKEALVAGGGRLNASFMKENLIDEIYLDVEPIVLGRGIPLFAPFDFQSQLSLLGVKKLSPKTIQLHYRVRK